MFKGSDIPRPDTFEGAVNERDAWIETAAQHCINEDYWRQRFEREELEKQVLVRVLAETVLEKVDLQRNIEGGWNIVEVAVRNPRVSAYMNHWEARALQAEAKNLAMDIAMRNLAETFSIVESRLELANIDLANIDLAMARSAQWN